MTYLEMRLFHLFLLMILTQCPLPLHAGELDPAIILESPAGRFFLRELGAAVSVEREESVRALLELRERMTHESPESLRWFEPGSDTLSSGIPEGERDFIAKAAADLLQGANFAVSRDHFLSESLHASVLRPVLLPKGPDSALGHQARSLVLPDLDTVSRWFVSADMRVPPKVLMLATKDPNRAEFIDDVVEVPCFMESPEGRQVTRDLFMHEFVHDVFWTNSTHEFAWAREYKALEKTTRVKPTNSRLEPQWRAKVARKEELKGVISAYNEFYADMVDVLLRDNGRAMEDAYGFLEPNAGPEGLKGMRDFTAHFDLQTWDYEGPYTLLNPTKEFVWKTYLSNPDYAGRKPELVRKIYDAITAEISARLTDPGLRDLKPRDLNRRLIARIRVALPTG